MARRKNPDTTTLAILAGGAALVFLLGRKKTAPAATQPPPPSENIVAVEQPVSVVAQGEIAVEQPPVVAITEATPPVESTGTVSLSSGGAPAVLLLNDQRTNYDVPSAPAAVQVKLPVGQVILRLQYADGTQSVRRVVVIEQGLTKEVVIMAPILTRNASGTGVNPTGNIQVISPDAGLLVVDGAVISSLAIPAAPRTRIFPYTPQNGRYDITLQIKYPDGVLSDKAPVRVISGQTVSVTIPPRRYSNTPQGLINLNSQSLATFNPNLVGGRQSVVGTAVNNQPAASSSLSFSEIMRLAANSTPAANTGVATLSVTSDADATLVYGGFRASIGANKPYIASLVPQVLALSVVYNDGTTSAPQTVTLVGGQTKSVTFTKVKATPTFTFGGKQQFSTLADRPSFLQQQISGSGSK